MLAFSLPVVRSKTTLRRPVSDLTLCSNTLGKVAQELMGPIFGSLNIIKGHAGGNLVVYFVKN